jgi:uncharacterized protein YkwD
MTVPSLRLRALLLLALSLTAVFVLLRPPSVLAGTDGMNAAEVGMFDALNGARDRRGLRPLTAHPRLTRAVSAYARVMIKEQRWAHADNIMVPGFGRIGEILARFPGDVDDAPPVVHAWLDSPGHRHLLLDDGFRYIGVATIVGRLSGSRTRLWVVRLGS